MPQTDPNQTIHRLMIDAPAPGTLGRVARHGNQSLHIHVERPRGEVTLGLTVVATRREDAGRNEPLSPEERTKDLAAEPLVLRGAGCIGQFQP